MDSEDNANNLEDLEHLMQSATFESEESPLFCVVCYEVAPLLSYVIEGNTLCGHGSCKDCIEDMKASGNDDGTFLCPTCRALVVNTVRNMQVEHTRDFLVRERHNQKKLAAAERKKREEQEKITEEERIRREEAEKKLLELQALVNEMNLDKVRLEDEIKKNKDYNSKLAKDIELEREKLGKLEGGHKQETLNLQEKIKVMEENLIKSEKKQKVLRSKAKRSQNQINYHIEKCEDLIDASKDKGNVLSKITSYMSDLIWRNPSSLLNDIDRYQILEKRGKSKNSRVCRATKNNCEIVAVKKFTYNVDEIFPNSLLSSTIDYFYLNTEQRNKKDNEKKLIQQNAVCTTFREPVLMYYLRHCPFINGLTYIIPEKQRGDFYVETEYRENDLDFFLEDDNDEVSLESKINIDFKTIFYQILYAVNYMHNCEVVHRNLSPSSILISKGNKIQIGGFSKAISILTLKEKRDIPYEPSDQRFAAPELSLTRHEVIKSSNWKCIDMFSVGCLFACIIHNNYLFGYSNSPEQRLYNINAITECRSKKKNYPIEHHPLAEYITGDFSDIPDGDLLHNLIVNLLCFEPEDRLTAQQALEHEYFANYREMSTRQLPDPLQCSDSKIMEFFLSLNL